MAARAASQQLLDPNDDVQSDVKDDNDLLQSAEARAANAPEVDPTERIAKPDAADDEAAKENADKQVKEAISDLQEDARALEQRQESTAWLIKVGTFVLLFLFGFLMIFGIFALIFYGLDKAAAAFEFDISEYTLYIILLSTLLNLVMSCFGCWGTYMFSDQYQNDLAELDRVTKSIRRSADEINNANEELGDVFTRLEVEIRHFQGENQELKESLRKIERAEQEMENFAQYSKDGALTLAAMKKIWDKLETEKILSRITAITAEYYKYAYQDGDRTPGMNEHQYEMLIQGSAVTPQDRRYFPNFNHSVWRKGAEENILVDEFERVLVLIYREILRFERKLALDEEDDNAESRRREEEEMQRVLSAARKEVKQQHEVNEQRQRPKKKKRKFFGN